MPTSVSKPAASPSSLPADPPAASVSVPADGAAAKHRAPSDTLSFSDRSPPLTGAVVRPPAGGSVSAVLAPLVAVQAEVATAPPWVQHDRIQAQLRALAADVGLPLATDRGFLFLLPHAGGPAPMLWSGARTPWTTHAMRTGPGLAYLELDAGTGAPTGRDLAGVVVSAGGGAAHGAWPYKVAWPGESPRPDPMARHVDYLALDLGPDEARAARRYDSFGVYSLTAPRGRSLQRFQIAGRDVTLMPPAPGHDATHVLYMLDGQNLWAPQDAVDGGWDVRPHPGPNTAVVSIDTVVGRLEDLTFEPHGGRGGAGTAFLATLVGDIVPEVETQFTKARGMRRGLAGSSLGGLFAAYTDVALRLDAMGEDEARHLPPALGAFRQTLRADPAWPSGAGAMASFDFVGAMSPALWWRGQELSRLWSALGPSAGRVYLDHGGAPRAAVSDPGKHDGHDDAVAWAQAVARRQPVLDARPLARSGGADALRTALTQHPVSFVHYYDLLGPAAHHREAAWRGRVPYLFAAFESLGA